MKRILLSIFFLTILCSAAYSGVIYYDDPLTIGVGARPIGMGRAFVAISDDDNAILINPSGIGTAKKWSLSSMSANFLDEYQYTMVSGIYPTKDGVWGAAYVSSKVTGVLVVTGGTIEGTTDYYNQALVLSYGKYVGDALAKYTWGEKEIYGGLSLKYYSKGFGGDVVASGAGYNFDLGLKYIQDKNWSYGLNFQNILLGGQIAGDFDSETVPYVAKLGVSYYFPDQKLRLALDKDMLFGREEVPWPMHFGGEWHAHENLYLRAGFDQIPGAAGGGDMSNDTTFGIGIEYDGLKVDLAYMQNFADTNSSTSFLSISYFSEDLFKVKKIVEVRTEEAVQPSQVQSKVQQADKVVISSPDNVVTYDYDAAISGRVRPDVAGDLWVGDKKAEVWPDGSFTQKVPLSIGMNEKFVQLKDLGKTEVVGHRHFVRIYVPLDIRAEDLEQKDFEEKIVYSEMFNYLGKDYSLDRKVSREILALIISKAMKISSARESKAIAKDVPLGYWAENYINSVLRAGYMKQYVDGTFKPDRYLSRYDVAQIMGKVSGYGENDMFTYLAGKSLDNTATIGDMIYILYKSGLMEEEIGAYKDFISMSRATI
jgi:hypothetical protein